MGSLHRPTCSEHVGHGQRVSREVLLGSVGLGRVRGPSLDGPAALFHHHGPPESVVCSRGPPSYFNPAGGHGFCSVPGWAEGRGQCGVGASALGPSPPCPATWLLWGFGHTTQPKPQLRV